MIWTSGLDLAIDVAVICPDTHDVGHLPGSVEFPDTANPMGLGVTWDRADSLDGIATRTAIRVERLHVDYCVHVASSRHWEFPYRFRLRGTPCNVSRA